MTERRSTEVEIALLRQEVATLKSDIVDLTRKVEDLVNAWNAAGGLVKFVKWTASVLAACGVIYAAAKGYWPK